jgi:hypothetical protein
MVIGILEAIGLGLNLIGCIWNYANLGEIYMVNFIVGIVSAAISILVIGLLFYGLSKQKGSFLIPHLVLQVIGIIFLGIAAVFAIILLVTGGGLLATMIQTEAKKSGQQQQIDGKVVGGVVIAVGVVMLIGFALAAALEIWFFLVILNCYRFFRDQDAYGGKQIPMAGNVVYGGAPAPVYGQPQAAYPPGYNAGPYYGK